MTPEWIAILPHVTLAAGGTLAWCLGAFFPRAGSGLHYGVSVVAAAGALISALCVTPATREAFGMVDASGLGRLAVALPCALAFLVLLFSRGYTAFRGLDRDEFHGLVLLSALGMALAGSGVNWLVVFLGIEILSVALYVLIAFRPESGPSIEAGVKYFIMGAVASAFLVFGIALLYAASGTLDIAGSLGAGLSDSGLPVSVAGLAFIVAGVGFKVSAAPFHLWTPDVYEGAPAPVTAFLSTGSKAALMVVLIRVALVAEGPREALLPVLWGLSVATMVAGNVAALAQGSLKRLLAYSSVAQMGYVLMALTASRGNGAAAALFYLVTYAAMDLGAFGAVALLSRRAEDLGPIASLRGLGRARPFESALLALSILSLAGLPPTGGFMAKIAVFRAVFDAGFVVLGVVGIGMAALAVFYYLKVVVALYMAPDEEPAPDEERLPPPAGLPERIAGLAVMAALLWLGVAPTGMLGVAARAALWP